MERFAREDGVCILAHARKETLGFLEKINALKTKHPRLEVIPFYCDLKDADEVKNSFADILRRYKRIDVLVNNAGVQMPDKSFLMKDDTTLRGSFEINFFAQVKITQMVCRAMIRNKCGAIVNMVSKVAFSGAGGQFEYVTSKAAVVAMTLSLSKELAPYHIRVNAVAPSLVDTDMMKNIDGGLLATLLDRSIAQRLAEPAEIANAVYYLASDEASFINGQCLLVDGGGYGL